MQLQVICRLACISMVIFIFSSCSKPNTQGKLIPINASVVIQVDGKSLSSKLSWDEIKQNPLFKEMHADSSWPSTVKNLLDNPDNAGIDTKADLLFFVLKDSAGGYIGFEGNVKDEATFKKFNQQITENSAASEKDGVLYISKSPVCVGWTKEKFVYIVDLPQMDELSKRMVRDSIDISGRSTRDIDATCKSIFALKEDNSLAEDGKFTTLMKETGDVHIWVNSEELSKGGSAASALAMVNMDKLLKGNITAATLNFDNGKMTMKSISYASEEMINLFKKYGGGKINEDMIRRMPGKDIVAVMALNFKPEGLRELIKMTGLDGLVNVGVEKLGFTTSDFIKANKGDIFIGLSDLNMNPTGAYPGSNPGDAMPGMQQPTFNLVFSASIGDKDAFNKIVAAGKKLGQEFSADSSKLPVAYNLDAKYFVMSNTKQNVDQYLSTAAGNFDFINKIGGEPFGGYVNIQSLLRSFESMATKDSAAKIAYDASLKMWDNAIWKGGNFTDGGIVQMAEINLVDKTTNSLKQLNQYLAKFSELLKDQKRKNQEGTMSYDTPDAEKDVQASPPAPTK